MECYRNYDKSKEEKKLIEELQIISKFQIETLGIVSYFDSKVHKELACMCQVTEVDTKMLSKE